MPTEYDARRPRLPVELAERVDAARGQVPFNRYVVQMLEKALPGSAFVEAVEQEQALAVRELAAAPAGAPRSENFVCPVASCRWPGAKSAADGPCPQHGRNLIPRRK